MEQETVRLNNLKKNCDEQLVAIKRETERIHSEIQAKTLKIQALENEREEANIQLAREKGEKENVEFIHQALLEEVKGIQFENDQYAQKKVF